MSLFKKAWFFLNHQQKKYAIFIFALIFLAMILECLSVGIVLPLLSIFLKGDIETSFFSHFFSFAKLTGQNLIYFGLLITFIIFLTKNLFLIFNFWHQTKFIRKIRFELTNRLFKYYLKSDYIFFLRTNSAHLYRNLTEIIGAYLDYISRYMVLLSEGIIFIGVVLVLFYVDFLGTIIILFSICIVGSAIYLLTKKKINFLW